MEAIERIALLVTTDLEAQLLLSRFHPLPEFVVDNAELRYLDDFPLFPRVRPRDPFAGARILDVAAPVPFKPTDIECIVKYASAAVCLTTNCCISPGPATGARNVLEVQLLGDRARTTRAIAEFW